MGFNDFIREPRYLNNVSDSTLSWYTHPFKWLACESPSQEQLKDTVLRMREQGLKPRRDFTMTFSATTSSSRMSVPRAHI
jgi:hypothetical protein